MGAMPHVVAAPDKFRGTASARRVAGAIAAAARAAGWSCDEAPVSDGGEGFAEVLGGAPVPERVSGPLGDPVASAWFRRDDATAVVEMALASGLELAGGSARNDPVRADTVGTGQLVAAAARGGARTVLVGMGGSATTDGGWGAVSALQPTSRLAGVELLVACDVRTRFLDAATVFSPQKGATPAQVQLLSRRLARLAQMYEETYGVDVTELEGSGAAGGLAGGLAAIGGRLCPGFELVAAALELPERLQRADLVVTGEGLLDAESWNGKSVGGVVSLAEAAGVPVLVVVGEVVGDHPVPVHDLVGRCGPERARVETLAAVQEVVGEVLAGAW